MRNRSPIGRRLLLRAAGAASALSLAGCDKLTASDWFRSLLGSAEGANLTAQRLLAGRRALAPEYTAAEMSPRFRSNGTSEPDDPGYKALARDNFAGWRLEVGGLVERPASFSLAELAAMPSRTQITRHDCVEGWSCIGKWTGVRLGALLDTVGLKPSVRYLVFHCADALGGGFEAPAPYYESIDLVDAFHEQTILAYAMNGAALPVPHGAPLRLRVENQLGYKMAKYVMRIEAIDDFARIAGGRGGYWEDRGYAWYAGI
jgi:DMSO/TMAO reductase YedYZ molybdopterin-dependent catalytic subunit